jgi:signal peptidase
MDQPKSKNSLKVVKITLNVVFYTLIALLLLYSIIVITSRGENSIPNVFGNGLLAVETDSMVGDNKDSFNPKDLIFVKILSEDQKANLKVGQVITFNDPAKQGRLNTHRIVDIRPDGLIQTKGDNTSQPDIYLLELDSVVAIYTSKLAAVGGLILFLQTQLGFGLLVLLPIFLVLVYQGIVLFNNIYKLKKAKLEEEFAEKRSLEKTELMEEEKEKIRKELMEELKTKEK